MMISVTELQTALIAKLQADVTLITILPEGVESIREMEWRGTDFEYPCVRVSRVIAIPAGRCLWSVNWTVAAYSKRDSSISAQNIQGLIVAALDGRQLNTPLLSTTSIRVQAAQAVSPTPGEDLWTGQTIFTTLAGSK